MKTLTICGSMRFEKEMCSIAYDLETKYGYAVLQCVYAPKDSIISPKALENLRHAHYRKIDLSDGIYVVNLNGYIGESVKAEIEYAKGQGKEVIFHC